MLPPANTVAEPRKGNTSAPLAPLSSTFVNAVPIAFAPPTSCSAPAGTDAVAPGAPMGPSPQGMQIIQVNQTRSPSVAPSTDLVETRKRKNDDAVLIAAFKRQATHELVSSNTMESSDQVCQYMGERELKEFSFLKLENRMLREECTQFEMAEKELLLKEHNLRLEIEQAQSRYKSLLNEYVSVSAVPTQNR
uniref:Uncharacterized protein n=1 Tax=Arundo donax TaxID=35708 RepID=A0A0A9DRB1_ARUDO